MTGLMTNLMTNLMTKNTSLLLALLMARFAILQNTFEPINLHHLGFDRVCFSLGLDPADSAVRDFVSGVVTPWTTEQNNQAMSSGLRYRSRV